MGSIDELKAAIEAEARRMEMSLDREVYEAAGKDPYRPILYGGQLAGDLAFFARDLGRQEVLLEEPLIGDAGQRVRKAIYRRLTGQEPPKGDVRLAATTDSVLLTNTVPYKPVGNKAYPNEVKERLRPYIAQLLVCHWQGTQIITMGTEAFQWFAAYAEPKAAAAFWKREDRFEAEFGCTLTAECDGQTVSKLVTVCPLPHPSPLNRTYLALFPCLLEARLGSGSPQDPQITPQSDLGSDLGTPAVGSGE
jgi:uracil-DNA glycosylase